MSIKIYSLVVGCVKSGGAVNTKLYLAFLTSGRFILIFLVILLKGGQ
jgi:zona occludens toxin (predicted ATPase)